MESRVFLVTETALDVSRASEYGELITLLDEKLSVFSTDAMVRALEDAMDAHGYDPAEDYLLVSGAQGPIVLATAVAVSKSEEVKLLFFDTRHSDYRPRVFRRTQCTPISNS